MAVTSEERLGTQPIGKLMLSMGIPTLIAQLINMLYSMVDRIYIGHIEGVGANALTGVGLCLPMIMLVSAFSSFAGAGGAPLAAIALGKGEKKQAEKILGNAFLMLIFFSAVLMFVFYIFKKPFLYAIGASDATYIYADKYISIYLLGTLFVQISVGMNTFITAQGKSNIAMASIMIGAVLNIVLDPIFIYGFKMDVAGAAWATVISQACSAIWIMKFLMSKKTSLRLVKSAIRPDFPIIGNISALGVAPFIMQSTESLISVVLNSGLQKYGGDLYVGSLTILQSVMQFMSVGVQGFSQGVQPIMSYNYGAGNIERVKRVYKRLITINVVTTAGLSIVIMRFPKFFAKLFTDDVQLIELVGEVLPIFIFGMLIFGLQMGCQQTFLALGQAKYSLFFAMLRKVLLLTPLAIILPRITNNVMGIYYAEPISDILAASICGIVFFTNIKKILQSKLDNSPEV